MKILYKALLYTVLVSIAGVLLFLLAYGVAYTIAFICGGEVVRAGIVIIFILLFTSTVFWISIFSEE